MKKLFEHSKFITDTVKDFDFVDEKKFVYWLISTIRDKSFTDGENFIRKQLNDLTKIKEYENE